VLLGTVSSVGLFLTGGRPAYLSRLLHFTRVGSDGRIQGVRHQIQRRGAEAKLSSCVAPASGFTARDCVCSGTWR